MSSLRLSVSYKGEKLPESVSVTYTAEEFPKSAGDISPNPGPSSIHNFYQSCSAHRTTNTRNPHNLIPIICQKSSTLPFSCALWNARSVCNKLTYIHDLFISNSLNLLALTETWLSPSDTASTAALSYGGLHFSHTPRPGNKQGGGVGILLSSRCSFNCILPVPSLQFSSFEVHTIRLFSPISLRVAVIYRPPGPASQFLDHFAWLPHFLSSNIPSLILGDFNIATDTPTSPTATKLLALTSSLGLSQWIESPTHQDGHSLDLIFSNHWDPVQWGKGKLAPDDSGHFSVNGENCWTYGEPNTSEIEYLIS
ncbi:LOW QUALITY PROTEIN: uncharacterized protein O3C94_011763 [Discoglossus pictus]